MSTLFISDLHLDEKRSAVIRAFFHWLKHQARQADALYILGDFFEVWIGDDDDAKLGQQVACALQELNDHGVPVYIMHGNRDFLLGQQFCNASGCQLLADPCVIKLYGRDILLAHGDALCIDDKDYMQFRAQCRNEAWQTALLSQPLEQRRLLAQQLRQQSMESTSNKAEDIMDVNATEVTRVMAQHQCDLLIHGHTHRPAIHLLQGDNNGPDNTRIVLGDWEQFGWQLNYQPDHSYQLDKFLIE